MAHDGLMDDRLFMGGAPGLSLSRMTFGLADAGELGDMSDRSLPSTAHSTPGASAGYGGRGGAAVGGLGGGVASTGYGSACAGNKLRVQLPASCDPPLPDTPTKPLVWIVFGGTGHMGRSLVKCALAHGDYVMTVGRTHETSPTAMQALAASAEQAALSDGERCSPASGGGTATTTVSSAINPPAKRCVGGLCDVRARETVDRVVQRTLQHFGRIDVVANCSGYGVVGACEDQDEHELRNQFETNFMGTLHILQATLPILRRQQEQQQERQTQVQAQAQTQTQTQTQPQTQTQQQPQQPQQPSVPGQQSSGGRYLIFSSTAGALGVPGMGPYCATKYAVEGLIEAMLYEVDAFNIKATLVEPGLMRRDDYDDGTPQGMGTGSKTGAGAGTTPGPAGSQAAAAARGPNANPLPTWGHFLIKQPSEVYAGASAPSLHATRMVQWLGDRQPASVVLCAELVWQLAHCSFPPLRLPLGSYAIESIRDRLRSVTEELEDWKHLNFPMPLDAAAVAAERPEKVDKVDKVDKTDKTDKTEKMEKTDMADTADKDRAARDDADETAGAAEEHDVEMTDIGS